MVQPHAVTPLTTIIETGNESYRFCHSSHTAKARIKSREQARLKPQEVPTDPLTTK